MRKRAKKPLSEEEEFSYRRENMFDFEAWYRAHFNDDFETKMRSERRTQFEQQYREQMERISRRDGNVRPPRRFVEPKYPSDIDIQMEEMLNKEVRKEIANVLMLGLTLIVTLLLIVYLIESSSSKGPYVDPYAIEKRKESPKTKDE